MHDNSVSQRDYNPKSDRYTESNYINADFGSAFATLESLIQNYERQFFAVGADFEPSSKPSLLGKRNAEAAVKKPDDDKASQKKRDQKAKTKDELKTVPKEEVKSEAAPSTGRKSTRIAAQVTKPIYTMPTDADLDRLDGGAGSKGGSISVMLAQTYDPDRDDPKGWLMSEKLDGVRCYWNGTTMFTRNGNRIFAPDEWRDQLPKIALDGELWSGRDNFQSIVSTVRRTEPDSDKWKDIKFMVFDAPLVKGTFAQRLKLV